MPAAQRLEITPALMRQAWLQQPRGPAWPPTFEEAERHPFFKRLLRCRAIGLAQAQQRQRQPGAFDPRRAAANDLE